MKPKGTTSRKGHQTDIESGVGFEKSATQGPGKPGRAQAEILLLAVLAKRSFGVWKTGAQDSSKAREPREPKG